MMRTTTVVCDDLVREWTNDNGKWGCDDRATTVVNIDMIDRTTTGWKMVEIVTVLNNDMSTQLWR